MLLKCCIHSVKSNSSLLKKWMVRRLLHVPFGFRPMFRCYISFRERSSYCEYMDVSKNNGTPKSSILVGFSLINHPFWGTPIFGNTMKHPYTYISSIFVEPNKPPMTGSARVVDICQQPAIGGERIPPTAAVSYEYEIFHNKSTKSQNHQPLTNVVHYFA